MTSPVKKIVEIFYDVISPYSWFAFEVLCRYRTKWDIELHFKPIFTAAIMQASDNKPPGQNPAKAAYLGKDLHRLAKYYSVPVQIMSNPAEVLFVKGTLPTQRFLTAVQMQRPELTELLSRELWMRIWHLDEDVIKPESLRSAGKNVGLSDSEIESFLRMINEDAVKLKLKQITQEALDHGAFGVPTIIVHDSDKKKHMMFGSDRMHIIAMLLNEKYVGPLTELAQSKL